MIETCITSNKHSIISHQLSITAHQLSITAHQLSIIFHKLSFSSHEVSITSHHINSLSHHVPSHQLSIISHELSIISHQPSIISHQPSIISHHINSLSHHIISSLYLITSHQLSIISHELSIISHQLSIPSHHINSLSTGWGWSHRRCHSEVPVVTSHQVTRKWVVINRNKKIGFPSSKYAFSRVTNNRIDFNKGKSTTSEEPHRNDHPPTNHLSSVQQHSKQARTDRIVDRHTTDITYILPSPSLPPYDGPQWHSDHHSLQLHPMTSRLLRM